MIVDFNYLFPEIILRHCLFCSVASPATRNNIFNNVSRIVVNSVYAVVKIKTSVKRVIYLRGLFSAIKTISRRNFDYVFSGEIPINISSFCIPNQSSKEAIEGRLTPRESVVFAVVPTLCFLPISYVTAVRNDLLSTIAQELPLRMPALGHGNESQSGQVSEFISYYIYPSSHAASLKEYLQRFLVLLSRQYRSLWRQFEIISPEFCTA